MSSKSNGFENGWLKLEFQNIDYTGLGDAGGLRGSATPGSYYVGLHSADPGEAGSQNTSELSYTGYVRQAVSRNGSAGWTVTNNNADNAAIIAFGKRTDTGATQTARFWSLGHSSSGAGTLNRKGHIGGAPIVCTMATSDTITVPGHTMVVGDEVVFYAFQGATLGTGVTEGTVYFVKTAGTDVITISTTSGGSTLDITGVGAGYACPISAVAIGLNNNPQFAIGALDIFED